MLLLSFLKKNRLVLLITFILFLIPFFWFKPGAMDLGGDGTRLYFYNPLEFLENTSLYSIAPEGKGNIDPSKHAYLIYVGLLAVIKYFINSPHSLINIFNGLKLSVGFISIYFIAKEFILEGKREDKKILWVELSAIIAGFFYILATGSEKLIFFWVKALFSHDQVFLNPLMFLLLMRYFLTRNRWYFFTFLFVSFLFSSNFAMIASPPFFAFYPLAMLFLLIYVIYIKKIKIVLRDVAIFMLLFLGLQSFHLIPSIVNLFDPSSLVNSIVFKETVTGGVNFFDAIHGEGKASISFLVPSPVPPFRWTAIVVPLIIILGFLLQRKKNKEILLTSFFFLITFFLVTANVTAIGLEFYRRLFYIPGFSMFRHFSNQWAYIFIFFYALLLGQSLSIIFARLKSVYVKLTAAIIIIIFVIGFWSFLNGELVDGFQWGSNEVKTAMIMDPRYEETLEFIRELPDEGKILILPLTSYFHQIVYGTNNAAYVGPSSISFLTHKKSFAGYQIFYPSPLPEDIMRFAREGNYEALDQIFSLFNIRYIFHNTDPKIYEEKFSQFPNDYMMTSLPKTQEEYKEFVKKFPVRLLYENGPYQIFELDEKVYRPEVYIPDCLYQDDMVKLIGNQKLSYQSAFLDQETCQKNQLVSSFCKTTYNPPRAEITIKKINPTQYTIQIKQSEDTLPILLVFQNSHHKDWKLSLDQNPPLSDEKHLLVNKYANAWIITKDDLYGQGEHVLYLNLETQRYFRYGLFVTGFTLLTFIGIVILTIVSLHGLKPVASLLFWRRNPAPKAQKDHSSPD